jgi:hypothetical protein
MKVIVFTRPDGGRGIVFPFAGDQRESESDATFLARVQAKDVPPDATGVQIMDSAAVPPDSPAVLPYRVRRAIAYRDQLGADQGDFVKTIGDVLDALIRAHYGDTSDLDVMKAKIDAIKASIPKS